MKLVLVGEGAGIVRAWALTDYLTNLLFGVRLANPATFTGVAVLMTWVALAACNIPARHAAKVDPIAALRYE